MVPLDFAGDRVCCRSTAAHHVAFTTIRACASLRSPSQASAQKPLAMRTATVPSSSVRCSSTGVMNSGSMWRHANAGALRVPKGRQAKRLRVSCAPPPSDPESKWWIAPLSPEDLVEPTGQGLEELGAIWNALVRSPLRPVLHALQEIKATGGNIFRCHSFHAGLVSGPLLLMASFCQLYQVAPNLCLDIVLGFMYYMLSVLSAELKTNGKANNICTRIQCVLLVVLWCNGNNYEKGSYFFFTRFIWSEVDFGCLLCHPS
ncbi:hypothetical protein EJB05_39906 [Eragrostis curvula]|uniref:Uncharacterized protein n=1 Tax=Eragrostis curvula TaxID=38414 RepID=A0A5J9TYT7_9POAL|nr:hypothetical protein EJB05_39906 [Eragrostis curvula]